MKKTNWEEIKEAYTEGYTVKGLAVKYGVKENTIKGRKQREKWKRREGTPKNECDIDTTVTKRTYKKGYTPQELHLILKPYSKEEEFNEYGMPWNFEEIVNDMNKDDDDGYLEERENDMYRFRISGLADLIEADKVALGIGAKNKVSLKYNGEGKLISETISNIQPTKEEIKEAISIINKSADFFS